jgi:hypothetical protein
MNRETQDSQAMSEKLKGSGVQSDVGWRNNENNFLIYRSYNMSQNNFNDNKMVEDFIIHTYTRAEAIADGLLVLVDEKMRQEAGFKYPIAIHKKVWDLYVDWTAEDNRRQTYQDVSGRLWDILMMLRFMAGKSQTLDSWIQFTVHVIPRQRDSHTTKPQRVHLWANIHPGDNGEPVITMMENKEDA